MIVVIDEIKYYNIYSNIGKKILETTNNVLWNATEESPIAVNIQRYNNGDYVESDEDLDIESTEESNVDVDNEINDDELNN